MKKYIQNFLINSEFEIDDQHCLIDAYDKINNNASANKILTQAITDYNNDMNTDWSIQLERANQISQLIGIHVYTVNLLLCICLSKKLREYYSLEGISLDIWQDTMLDFKYKNKECRLIKGICGTFVPTWYGKFFVLNLFSLGRLQFQINTLRYDYNKNGVNLKVGAPVVDIHIPKTETPLDRKSCIDSYEMAKNFFASKFIGQPMPFVCHSWLLFEQNKKMLNEKSNILAFMNDFDIISNDYEKPGDYSELWRLYDMDYTGNLDDFPGDTSFRRAYKAYLKAGGAFGSAYGIFIK